MGLARGFLMVVIFTLAIPAIGYVVSTWIIGDANSDLALDDLPSMAIICANTSAVSIAEIREACEEYQTIVLLGKASILAVIIGVSLPILYLLASLLAGKSRARIAAIFPPLIYISLFIIAISVLLQGGILTYAAYVGEIYAIGRVHFVIIGAIGIGALIAAYKLILVSFSFAKKHTMHTFGKSLTENEAPNLFSFVNNLAEKLGARPPKNIVVGLEPTLYVTSCDVNVLGEEKTLSGETLYVSAPLSRLMSKSELAAVIGHELGHFRGKDTVYSLKFAPVYGLGGALGAIATEEDEDEGVSALAKLPAIAMLSFMYVLFSRNVSAIGRERELRADEAGADVSSPLDLASSLIKISLYSGLWPHAQERNVERLNESKITRNLSKVFQDSARYDVEHERLDEILDIVLEDTISHPTDTHPTVAARLSALGVEPSQISKDTLLVPSDSAIDLIDNSEEIEEELTLLEHRLMVALKRVELPEDDEEEQDYLLRATYCFAAAMVMADGKIDPKEIEAAEGIGGTLFDNFDPIDFREFCNNPEEIPDIEKLSELVGDSLPEDGKVLILKYLRAISESEDEVDEREAALLSKVASTWGIDESALSEMGHVAPALSQNGRPAMGDVDAGVDALDRGDYETAFQEWHPLAKQGDSVAQYNLGSAYYYHYRQNHSEAAKWLRLSAEQGFARAQHDLGSMYYVGQGVPEDIATAVYWYELAAGQGLAMAQYNVGALYYAGDGIPQNIMLARTRFLTAARAGVPMAQNNLGTMYKDGTGVEQNYVEAIKWLRLAAEQSVDSALKSTGLFEEGVPPMNADSYTQILEEALAASKYNLAGMYAKGLGVRRDNVRAYTISH